jgi:hypothetical protein
MLPSLDISASSRADFSNDTMAKRPRNQQEPASILTLRTIANIAELMMPLASAYHATDERSPG